MKDWQPTASIPALRKRGEILANIRQFFAERNVLEVETPVMSHCAVSDPFIDSIETQYQPFPEAEVSPCYLQTSPEYAMKRLLAAGSGSIYQMAKAFRNGEQGHVHNPEFTMLEWYREGFDDLMLMSEVEALVAKILNIETPFIRLTYQQAFERYLAVDLTKCSDDEVKELALQHIDVNLENANRDDWLNLLMSHVIEPQLASLNQPVFITDYPASQAALARTKINANGKLVAARFELFAGGMELANGYHELTDSVQQNQRLAQDQHQRETLNLPTRPLEKRLVSALESGLPDCAGVALGVDRLVMLALKTERIDEVISFAFDRA